MTGVQTCALPISASGLRGALRRRGIRHRAVRGEPRIRRRGADAHTAFHVCLFLLFFTNEDRDITDFVDLLTLHPYLQILIFNRKILNGFIKVTILDSLFLYT